MHIINSLQAYVIKQPTSNKKLQHIIISLQDYVIKQSTSNPKVATHNQVVNIRIQ